MLIGLFSTPVAARNQAISCMNCAGNLDKVLQMIRDNSA
jgi:hypothetical protein